MQDVSAENVTRFSKFLTIHRALGAILPTKLLLYLILDTLNMMQTGIIESKTLISPSSTLKTHNLSLAP